MIVKIGKKELWVATGIVVAPAAIGIVTLTLDNVFPSGNVQSIIIIEGSTSLHDSIVLTRTLLRNALGNVPISAGQVADGFSSTYYNLIAVANNMVIWAYVWIER